MDSVVIVARMKAAIADKIITILKWKFARDVLFATFCTIRNGNSEDHQTRIPRGVTHILSGKQ